MRAYLILAFLVPYFLQAQKSDADISRNVGSIAFGSCSHQEKKPQLWKEVNSLQPDLWIWLGDNIYADTEDMSLMRKQYKGQKSHPEYQTLLSNTHVIGIWDDHDFGVNDGGKEYPMKKESKVELFRFLDVSKNNPANDREGAHQSYTITSEGQKVKVILLDTRYFRDPLKKNENNHNIPDEKGQILGPEQWEWFEDQIKDQPDLFILVSSIQVIPEEHRFEKWGNFPTEKERLFTLIKKHVNVPLIILSGDRHISEVSKVDLDDYAYPVYEFTSSSLTNPWGTKREEPNRFREKEIVYDPNFSKVDLKWTDEGLTLNLSYYGVDNKVLQTHEIRYHNP